ncbi:hypothetical protein ACJX0J_038996, partial [Zea mays]
EELFESYLFIFLAKGINKTQLTSNRILHTLRDMICCMVLMRKNQQNLNLMVFHIIFKRNNNDIIVTKLILFKLNTTIQTKYINSLYGISLRHSLLGKSMKMENDFI